MEKHERPEGIIALCHNCHDKADAGRYTKEQLRHLKKNPYINGDEISARYDYLRKNTVCRVGDFIGYIVNNILTIHGERVIWFERDENGFDQLNLLIRDYLGNIILKMENNDWIIYTKDIFDMECPAQGKSLKIISKDKYTNFELRFDDLTEEEFKALLLSIGHDEDQLDCLLMQISEDNPERIPLWTLKGKITYIDMDLNIKNDGWYIDIDGAIQNGVLRSCISVRSNGLVAIGEETYCQKNRSPAILEHQLKKRMQILSESRKITKSKLNEIDIVIEELEKLPERSRVFRNAGHVFFISDKDRLIDEFKNKRIKIRMQLEAVIQQEKRTNIRLRRLKKASDKDR